MRNSLIVRHLILEVYSGKSVRINNHIKETFIVQLTTGEYLVTKKTVTIEKLFFCKASRPFSQKIIKIHLYISYKAFICSKV